MLSPPPGHNPLPYSVLCAFVGLALAARSDGKLMVSQATTKFAYPCAMFVIPSFLAENRQRFLFRISKTG